MKNFKIVLLVLPLLGISCSEEIADQIKGTEPASNSARVATTEAANPANPYDSAGRFHSEILDALESYDFKEQSFAGIAEIVDSTAAMHPEIGLANTPFLMSERIQEITVLAGSDNSLIDVLDGSALGGIARASILELAGTLEQAADESYENIWLAMTSYEADVQGSDALSAVEKKTMLVTASVLRYSIQRKKRKDKDWETSVSIAAAVSGDEQSIFPRLLMAVAVTLCREDGIVK